MYSEVPRKQPLLFLCACALTFMERLPSPFEIWSSYSPRYKEYFHLSCDVVRQGRITLKFRMKVQPLSSESENSTSERLAERERTLLNVLFPCLLFDSEDGSIYSLRNGSKIVSHYKAIIIVIIIGTRGSLVVKALGYKPEGRVFETQ
jgi:hypothetical protein